MADENQPDADDTSSNGEPFPGFEGQQNNNMLMQLISQMNNVLQNQQQQLNQLMQNKATTSSQENKDAEQTLVRNVSASSISTRMSQLSVVPDLLRNLKEFSGTETSHEARAWLRSLNSAATIHQWPDAVKLEAARTRLKNAAENWYYECQETVTTWKTFEEQFTLAFIGEESLTEKWISMHARVQHRNEDISEYFYDKLRLCSALNMTFKESKRQIIEGLWSRDLSDHLLGTIHNDKYELLNSIKTYIAVTKARSARARDRSPASKSTNSSLSTNLKVKLNNNPTPLKIHSSKFENASLPQRVNDTPPMKKSEVRCYNCQKYGHISKDCPEPKRPLQCLKCKGEGHTARYCQVESQALVAIEHPKTRSNPFQKDVLVNNVNILGMIDSGVQHSLIRASAAIRTNLKVNSSVTPLYGVGNMDVPSTHTLGMSTCCVCIDGVEVPETLVHILPDHAIPMDILIGREWLHNPKVNYYRKENNFIIEEVVNPIQIIEVEREEPKMYSCFVKEDCSVLTEEHIQISENATAEEKQQVIDLCNDFRSCFALSLNELGCTNLTEMRIHEVEGSVPFANKPYKTTASEREEIRNILSDWRKHGIIEDTSSPYASPVLLVNKKNGEKRLCIDYRRLNSQTIRLPYPLPDLDSQLETLSDAHIFATLDLAHGFLQIPLAEDTRPKTAFVTPEETAQFVRMPFGLTNAPAEFQRLMNKALGPLRNTIVQCYLDDLLIPAKDWPTMLTNLRRVFEALSKANLTLKPSKCRFGVKTVEFLGFIISDGTIRPGDQKTLAISQFPTPRNIHEVRRFLGLTGFFRRFVKGYAELTVPLADLTKKNVPFDWCIDQETAFQKLKTVLTTEPVLKLFHPNAYTELHTDASSQGLAGILLQQSSEDNRLHLVYCISKKVSSTEQHYHSSRLELMAIVWSLKRLRPFLLGRKFTIITDCQSLVYMNVHKTKNPQIARWVDLIQDFDFEIKHRSGEKMAHVDALSRAPVEEADDHQNVNFETNNVVCVGLTKEEQVAMMQHNDANLQKLISLFNQGAISKAEESLMKNFALSDGILYRKDKGKLLLVIPKSMRKSIVVTYHDLSGHFGLDRTVSKIKENYWFGGMKRYVKQHIHMCFQCLLVKVPSGKRPGLLHPIPPGKRPFEVLHIDHVGPFETKSGCSYVLVMVDNLTKFVRLFPVKNTSTRLVVKSLEILFNERGLPSRIISDRGSCFTSSDFQQYCSNKGISHSLNSPRHPQANGQVERVNRVLVPTNAVSLNNNDNWVKVIPEVERNLNSSVNKTTGRSPFELLYGYSPKFHLGVLRAALQTTDSYNNPEELRVTARETIIEEQKKMKRTFDRKHCIGDKYEVGELVVMQKAPENTGQPTKLQDKYRGPLVVIDVLPNDTYRVTDLNQKGPRVYSSTAHTSQLKSWKIYNQDDVDDVQDNAQDDESSVETNQDDVDDVQDNAQDDESNVETNEDENVDGRFEKDENVDGRFEKDDNDDGRFDRDENVDGRFEEDDYVEGRFRENEEGETNKRSELMSETLFNNANEEMPGKRERKKPGYLKDYVLQ